MDERSAIQKALINAGAKGKVWVAAVTAADVCLLYLLSGFWFTSLVKDTTAGIDQIFAGLNTSSGGNMIRNIFYAGTFFEALPLALSAIALGRIWTKSRKGDVKVSTAGYSLGMAAAVIKIIFFLLIAYLAVSRIVGIIADSGGSMRRFHLLLGGVTIVAVFLMIVYGLEMFFAIYSVRKSMLTGRLKGNISIYIIGMNFVAMIVYALLAAFFFYSYSSAVELDHAINVGSFSGLSRLGQSLILYSITFAVHTVHIIILTFVFVDGRDAFVLSRKSNNDDLM